MCFRSTASTSAATPVLNKQLKRSQVMAFFANLPPCLIGMEACGSAHHWARKLQGLGHTARLIATQFVKPYVKSNKNDAADAEAICEAVARPNMRFVPIKNVEQQAVLALHRARHAFVKARTAQANQIRGLLAEFGLIIPKGIAHIRTRVPEFLEDASNELPGELRSLIQRLTQHLTELDRQADELGAQIGIWHRNNELSRKLTAIPDYGTCNRNGKYKVGRKTEKSRLRRSMAGLTALMRDIRHWSLKDQVCRLNQVLRGHYAYYGLAGNWRSLHKVYRFVERYWHKMLCSRSWAATITWEVFHRLRDRFPLQRPTIYLTYGQMQACAVL